MRIATDTQQLIQRQIARYGLVSDQVDEKELAIILGECLKTAHLPGDVVEFGCYVGTTSLHIARLLQADGAKLYVYDSFEGLPDKTAPDKSPVGEQFQRGELHATKRQFIMHFKKAGLPLPVITKGWFQDLSENDLPETIRFAFLDGDYYESVRDSLRLIEQHLAPGAIIVVDDYANEALPGSAQAVDEWLQHHRGTLRVEQSLAIIAT